uniref:Uncharacterized protein n=1 Tax=Lactuca sativa TaxID=4236 RepID=A0A9R1UH81_LACSA|nr:hypothetical protein LSAT_V11C900474000 [Lactuca sativa]
MSTMEKSQCLTNVSVMKPNVKLLYESSILHLHINASKVYKLDLEESMMLLYEALNIWPFSFINLRLYYSINLKYPSTLDSHIYTLTRYVDAKDQKNGTNNAKSDHGIA